MRSKKCDRARHWISLRADGELSEFEGVLLAAHLGRCAECRAFKVDVDAMVSSLREAPLERLSRPIELPRRGRVHVGSRLQHAGPAVAVIVLAIVSMGSLGALGLENGGHPSRPARTVISTPHDSSSHLRQNVQRPAQSRRLQAE